MPSQEADLDLLQHYAGTGDPEAFAQIVQRYAGLVFHTCLRVLHNRALAEEVSQDTFYRLMQRPGSVNRSLGAWLHKTATRRSLDVLRSNTARLNREREHNQSLYKTRMDAPSWDVLSPQIDEALNKIAEPNRSMLIDHFLLGKPQRQIAKETQNSTATVSRRIKQGLEDLRKLLGGAGLAVSAGVLAQMLLAQSAKAAPLTIGMQLGKMALISGPPASLGSGAVSVGAVMIKTSTVLAGVVAVGLGVYAMWHYGNGKATIIPAQPGPRASTLNQSANTIGKNGTPSIEEETRSKTDKDPYYNPHAMYLIPHEDPNFDSRIIVTFQCPPSNPDAKISVAFADGHAVQMTVRDADETIQKQTGKTMRELMEVLPPITMHR